MTKGSSRFSKLYSLSSSSNSTEEKILIDPETQIMIAENEDNDPVQSDDDQTLQRSRNVITKLFKSTMKSKLFNQKSKQLEDSGDKLSDGEDKHSTNSSNSNSTPVPIAVPTSEAQVETKSMFTDGFKLKGILKKARKSCPNIGRLDQLRSGRDDCFSDKTSVEQCQAATCSNENSYDSMSMNNNFDPMSSASSSPASNKSVKFNDVILKVKYTTSKSMSGLVKLSSDKRRRFTMFDKKEELNFNYVNMKEMDPLESSIDLFRFQRMSFYQSPTNNLSYEN